jgi:DNA repair exonuclease SbcCD ATPase subunit
MTNESVFDLKLQTLQQKLAELETVMKARMEQDQALRVEQSITHDKVTEANRRVDQIIEQLEELRRAG